MRYVLLFSHFGFPALFPEEPSEHNTYDSLAGCRAAFRDIVRETYADPQSWADVHLVSDWDGVSYGDCSTLYRLTLGPRGGVQVQAGVGATRKPYQPSTCRRFQP